MTARPGSPGPAPNRPVLALAATPATARRAVPLLALVGVGARIVSWHRLEGAGVTSVPDAILATTVDLLPGLPAVPTAVWVDSPAAVRTAAAHGVEVPLTSRASLVDSGAVLVPARGLDVGRYPVLPPLVRARTRLALGLPGMLVVAVDHTAPADDAATTLALVAAAVVTGPHLPLALALGTPVVTSPKAARRFGLQAGLEVEVAADPAEADRTAAALARDDERAAALSRRARTFAEHHLDLGRPARLLRQRLGLEPPASADPFQRLAARLDELAAPGASRLRRRAADAIALLPPAPLEESA